MDFSALNKEEKKETESIAVVKTDVFDINSASKKFDDNIIKLNEMKITSGNHLIIDEASNITAIEMASQVKKLYNGIEKTRKQIVEKPKQFASSIDKFCKPYKDTLVSIEMGLKKKIKLFARDQAVKIKEAEGKARKEQAELQKKLDADARRKQRELEEEARRRQRELEEKAEKQQKEAEEKARKEAEIKGMDPEKVYVPKIEAPVMPEVQEVQPVQAVLPTVNASKNVTRTAEGSASLKKKWVFDVENIAEVVKHLTESNDPTLLEKLRIAIKPTINAQIKAGIRKIPGLKIYETDEISLRVN